MRRLPLVSLALLAVVATACGSSDSSDPLAGRKTTTPPPDSTDQPQPMNDTAPPSVNPTPPPPGMMITTTTWTDGTKIMGNVTIAAGATVTIAPGATVTVADGASITIQGTLTAATNATHAKITSSGTWGGIVIAKGGQLSLDSVDLVNVKTGLWAQAGNGASTYKNGSLTAGQPLITEAGSQLTIDHSTLKQIASQSSLAGNFTATYMTYDKGGSEGFTFNDAAGSFTASDSTFVGTGGGDFIVVGAAKSLSLTYSTVSAGTGAPNNAMTSLPQGPSHCPMHFNAPGPTSYTIDHVTFQYNDFGWMNYASGNGPNKITNSNFMDTQYDIEMTAGGPVTLTGNYFAPKVNATVTRTVLLQANATRTADAPAFIASAKPR